MIEDIAKLFYFISRKPDSKSQIVPSFQFSTSDSIFMSAPVYVDVNLPLGSFLCLFNMTMYLYLLGYLSFRSLYTVWASDLKKI